MLDGTTEGLFQSLRLGCVAYALASVKVSQVPRTQDPAHDARALATAEAALTVCREHRNAAELLLRDRITVLIDEAHGAGSAEMASSITTRELNTIRLAAHEVIRHVDTHAEPRS